MGRRKTLRSKELRGSSQRADARAKERVNMSASHSRHCCREAARVKALRPLCGAPDAALTRAFLPGNFSAMWGMGRCESQSS